LRAFELAGFELKGDNWFLNDVIDDTDLRGFSHNEEGFYVYLGKIDEEAELEACLEDINIVFYRTEKHYQELDVKIADLHRELESRRSEDYSTAVRRFRSRATKQIVREVDEWRTAKEQMSKMYIALIIDPGINRTNFMREAKKLFSQHDRFELVVDKDNLVQFDSVKVKLAVLSK